MKYKNVINSVCLWATGSILSVLGLTYSCADHKQKAMWIYSGSSVGLQMDLSSRTLTNDTNIVLLRSSHLDSVKLVFRAREREIFKFSCIISPIIHWICLLILLIFITFFTQIPIFLIVSLKCQAKYIFKTDPINRSWGAAKWNVTESQWYQENIRRIIDSKCFLDRLRQCWKNLKF